MTPTASLITPVESVSAEVIAAPPRPPVVFRRFEPSRVIGAMTVDEYVAFDRQGDGGRYEYVEGIVIAMSGGSLEHSRIAVQMMSALLNVITKVGADCDVYGSDQKIFIHEQLYRYSDGAVACGESLSNPEEALQNPILIIEVLSRLTEREDRTDKFREYRRIPTLQHYLLIDQECPDVTHYEKSAQGAWKMAGEHTSLSESLTLTLDGKTVQVPLAAIYRRIAFAASDTATATEQNEEQE